MRRSKLFQANLIGQIILITVITVILSFFFSLTLRARLTDEFINRGTAISRSIANSSVELLLNRDASTIQATIDQFLDVESGVAYVFVVDDQAEFMAHTFVPGVPSEILEIRRGAKDRVITRDLIIPDRGEFIDIAAPILAGSVGYVHIGMDKGVIWTTIQSAIIRQVWLIAIIFLIALAIAYIQANRISRPLMRLAGYARRVTSGSVADWTASRSDPQLRAIAERGDEVGQLTSDFQHMVQQILEREQNLERRVVSLEIIATLSEQLSAILDLDQLMGEVVNQIKDQFDFYHAQIYLFDEAREKLRAATGTGSAGEELTEQIQTISVNTPTSLVARAARTSEIVRVNNVRDIEDWRSNPLLPDTSSVIAVPITLGVEKQVVGVLEVQEDKIAGLDEVDASMLRALANQVAVAIRNARLFAEVETALAEAHAAQQRYIERAWDRTSVARRGVGRVQYNLDEVANLTEATIAEARQLALAQREPVVVPLNGGAEKVSDEDQKQHALVAPIILQEIPVGNLQFHHIDPDRKWTEGELTLINAVIEQVAQTAESLRLFDETRERASRERLIGQVSDKLRRAPDVDALMQVAVGELARVLGPDRAFVRLGSEKELGGIQASALNNGGVTEPEGAVQTEDDPTELADGVSAQSNGRPGVETVAGDST